MCLWHFVPPDPRIDITITTGNKKENERIVTCRGFTLFGLPAMEISITDSHGYKSISANKTSAMQQNSFYYNAEQRVTVYIAGETWINCTLEDDIGTYTKTGYMNTECELTSIVQ